MDKNEPKQVHCSECVRGGNGDKSCAAGWTVKNKRGGNRYRMCLSGTTIEKKGGEA